ncbi:MAG: pyruvate kinase [Bacteroidia bacterium]|jgi:pyruvate kinase
MITDKTYNKTKIIATIGPATSDKATLRKMIQAGMDVARINFSHGTHEQHQEVVNNVKELNLELNRSISILGDLQGPKLRIGEVKKGTFLTDGHELTVTTKPCIGTSECIYVNYPALPVDIKIGDQVLIDDGNILVVVTKKVDEFSFTTNVVYGGPLSSNKGFNLPNTDISLPSLTEKDIVDLEFAVTNYFDWVGLSFVRKGQDVTELRKRISDLNGTAHIVAKIEKPQAIRYLKSIVKKSDAIMVARGDLGVEMPLEQVPMLQKKIVALSIQYSKPVIIATQMMESMITSARPTRAEASDVANAVMDGADAVMLSAETSVGKYPLEAVAAVQKIVKTTEDGWDIYYKGKKPSKTSPTFLSDQICFSAVQISEQINATAIISMTQSGYTAFKIASYRPKCNIFIFTSNKYIFRMLNLVWNVRVLYYDRMESTDQTIKDVLKMLKDEKLIQKGELVIHTASMPIMSKSKTNALKISRVD